MGSSSPKVKTPVSTLRQAERGIGHVNEYLHDGYKGLEQQSIKDAHKDETRYLATRAAVDNRIAQSHVPINFRDIGGGAAENTMDIAKGRTIARQQGQTIADRRQIAVGQSGMGLAKQSSGMRQQASQMAAENAFNDTQNKITVSNAKFGMGVDMITGAAKAYALEDQFKDDWAKSGRTGDPTFKDKFHYLMNGPKYLRGEE